MSTIRTLYDWHCDEVGCRCYFVNEDRVRLEQSITAHEAQHKLIKEQRENMEQDTD